MTWQMEGEECSDYGYVEH